MTNVIVRDYAAHQFAIEAKSQGNMRIREVSQYTFTVPTPVPVGPVLPSWLTHAWEADSLVLADGDPVATWVDSIAAAELAQTTPSLRPTYRADLGGSGYPGLSFDGADDYLISTAVASIFSAAGSARPTWTMALVLNGSGTNAGVVASVGNSGATTQYGFLPQQAAAGTDTFLYRNNAGTQRTDTYSVASRVGVRVATLQIDDSGFRQAWDNRTARLVNGTALSTGPYTFTHLVLGGLLRTTFSGVSTQDFHAVYLYDGVATPSELTELWDYATAKWGTP